MNFKDINIGTLLHQKAQELEIPIERICSFFKLKEKDIEEMFQSKNINTSELLKWSKLLKYDFFRIYSQHLILYSPHLKSDDKSSKKGTKLPVFRKNIYTKEIIDFIVEKVQSGKMTKFEVMNEYKIPKTTLYKWLDKYSG